MPKILTNSGGEEDIAVEVHIEDEAAPFTGAATPHIGAATPNTEAEVVAILSFPTGQSGNPIKIVNSIGENPNQHQIPKLLYALDVALKDILRKYATPPATLFNFTERVYMNLN